MIVGWGGASRELLSRAISVAGCGEAGEGPRRCAGQKVKAVNEF
jgi:hypothetical protein